MAGLKTHDQSSRFAGIVPQGRQEVKMARRIITQGKFEHWETLREFGGGLRKRMHVMEGDSGR